MAEDLAQEALLNLWRKAHLFDPAKASVATWLFTIARNLRIDAIRREKRPELDPGRFHARGRNPPPTTGLRAGRGRIAFAPGAEGAAGPTRFRWWNCPSSPTSRTARSPSELGIPLGTVKSRLQAGHGAP